MSQLIPKSAPLVVDNFCGNCGKDLQAQDNYCRGCGTPAHCIEATLSTTVVDGQSTGSMEVQTVGQNDSASPATTVAKRDQSSPANTIETVLNNRLYVGFVIALIGPLGLPALWFSPRFSKRTKIVATLLFVIVSAVLPLAIAWYFLDYKMRPLLDAFGI